MENSSLRCIFFIFIIFTLVSLSTAASSHGEVGTYKFWAIVFFILGLTVCDKLDFFIIIYWWYVEDEHEFNYKRNDDKGPERWGEIKPEWEMCGKGEIQSPIDLMNERVRIVSHLGRLIRDYEPSNATIKNRGHDIMVYIIIPWRSSYFLFKHMLFLWFCWVSTLTSQKWKPLGFMCFY